MDAGWAVVLGALIALTGSSIVPWLREGLAARTDETRRRRERVRNAVVDLLAANAAQGAAMTTDVDADFQRAFEDRARASAALLLEVHGEERRALSDVITLGSPGRYQTRERVRALEYVMTGWAAGEFDAATIRGAFGEEFERLGVKVTPSVRKPVVAPAADV